MKQLCSCNSSLNQHVVLIVFNSGTTYTHGGKLWDTPKDWTPPMRCLLRVGWSLWLLGQANNRTSTGIAPVKPFRLLKWVPRDVYLTLQHSWRPIFDLMENAPGMNIPANWSDITPEVLDSTYTKGLEYVQQQVGYIWNHEDFSKKDKSRWSTSTWSKYVKHSSVQKYGTPEDIANSEAASANRKGKRQRTLDASSQ
jgi:hypothetical protein